MTGARLVILDEPTSVLAPQEVEALFRVVDHLRGQGFGVVIVTHKLDEVRTIADRATVLRGGRTVMAGVRPVRLTNAELIEAMVGRSVPPLPERGRRRRASEPAALELTGVDRVGDRGNLALKGVVLRSGRASSSASPGSPAAASASCARSRSGCAARPERARRRLRPGPGRRGDGGRAAAPRGPGRRRGRPPAHRARAHGADGRRSRAATRHRLARGGRTDEENDERLGLRIAAGTAGSPTCPAATSSASC